MKRPFSIRVLTLIFAAGCGRAAADVAVQPLFGDHMVLQQEAKIPVWGTAAAGEKVSVTLGDKSATATADADGAWRVDLPPVESGGESRTLVIAGKNTLKFEDVLVGDIWVASGQSNMGYSLNAAHNAASEVPKANDPGLRLFKVPTRPAAEPVKDVAGKWVVCTPESAANFSAVAYFFARDLRKDLKRPIGVIGAYWGGTAAQAWTPLPALQESPPMTKFVTAYEQALEKHKAALADPKIGADYEAAEKLWKKEVAPAYAAATHEYFAASDAARAAGKPAPKKPAPSRPEPVNPDPMGTPNSGSRPGVPSVLFNGMIAPLTPYAIKGVIWYQGEANGGAGIEYRTLFPRLITGWRKSWGQGDFPFLFVQLPGWDNGNKLGDDWAYLREAQNMTLSLPNTGMAVTIDLGDPENVHPKDKVDVGDRLALRGEEDRLWSGGRLHRPDLRRDESRRGGRLDLVQGNRRRFDDRRSAVAGPGITAPPKDTIAGFSIAGEDKKWHPAEARIDGSSVIVSSADVPHPVAVRYGWLNSPVCNLYNAEGLPATPFRTDDWGK